MTSLIKSSARYLEATFGADDHIALTLVHKPSGNVVQRTGRAHHFAGLKYQKWLRYMNAQGYEIYCTMNTIYPHSFRRDKSSIAEVRFLYLDFDVDGAAALLRLRSRKDLPVPNYVVSTSPGKYQVLWAVAGFTVPSAEALLRALAREAGADIAATDAARVLRLPGFRNHKYVPAHPVTAEQLCSTVYSPADFPEPASVPTAAPATSTFEPGMNVGAGDGTRSGLDWRTTLSRLRRGEDAATIIADLIAARPDKANPRYYAERTVQRAQDLIRKTPSITPLRTHRCH